MKRFIKGIIIALILVTPGFLEAGGSRYFNINNSYGADTPQSLIGGKYIDPANGNLSVQWGGIATRGRAGRNLAFSVSCTSGPTEHTIEEFENLFENAVKHPPEVVACACDGMGCRCSGETRGSLLSIKYNDVDREIPGLGIIRARGEKAGFAVPYNAIEYDPHVNGWSSSWSEVKGIIMFSDVSQNRRQHARYVMLVKAGGAVELLDPQTGMDFLQRAGGVLLQDLITDADESTESWDDPLELIINGDGKLKYLDSSGTEYVLKNHFSDKLDYTARYVYRCGSFWNRHNCYDEYNLTGWKIDAFIVEQYQDIYGNKIATGKPAASIGEAQQITLQLMTNNNGEWVDGVTVGTLQHTIYNDRDEWSAEGDRKWTFRKDSLGRIVEIADPENNVTSLDYNTVSGFEVFPQWRKDGWDELTNPKYFVQIIYPTGGFMRYEHFDPIQYGEGMLRRTIITEAPNVSLQDRYNQKYFYVYTSNAVENEPDVDGAVVTSIHESGGVDRELSFNRKYGQLLLSQKTVTANNRSISENYEWNIREMSEEDGRTYGFVDGVRSVHVNRDGHDYEAYSADYDEVGRTTSTTDALNNSNSYSYSIPSSTISASVAADTDISLQEKSTILRQKQLIDSIGKTVGSASYELHYMYGGVDKCGGTVGQTNIRSVFRRISDNDKTIAEYCYDLYGNITKIYKGDGEESALDTEIKYDDLNRFIWEITENGKKKVYSYNSNTGLKNVIQYNNGSSACYQRDKIGRLNQIGYNGYCGANIAENEFYITHDYNLAGTSGGLNSISTTVYDGTQNSNSIISRYYDGYGLLRRLDKNGMINEYGYDDNRRLVNVVYPGGKRAGFEYDSFGRVIAKYLPGWSPIRYSYLLNNDESGFGDVVSMSLDGVGVIYSNKKDLLGRLISEKKCLNGGSGCEEMTTKYSYDNLNNITNIALPSGLSISNTINYQENSLSREYAGGDSLTIDEIDGFGLPGSVSDQDSEGNSYNAELTYSDNYFLQKIDLPPTEGLELNDKTFVYGETGSNSDGRLDEIIDYYGTTSFWYGSSGAVEGIEREVEELEEKYLFSYSKDAFGNIVRQIYPNGLTIYNILDDQMRVTEVRKGSLDGMIIAKLSYNADGSLQSIVYANGVNTGYSYDLAGRVARISVYKGDDYYLDDRYTYDSRGRKTSVLHLDNSRVDYSYDDINRLTKAEYYKGEADTPYETQEYGYDADGNRISYKDAVKEITYQMETGDDGNRISNKLKKKVVKVFDSDDGNIVTTFNYQLGRIVKEEERVGGELRLEKTYTYDADNLTKVEVVDHKSGFKTTSEYGYDYAGRRESVTVDGKTTYYGYGESLDPLIEVNDKGEVESAYIYIGSRRLAVIGGEQLKIYHADELGNTLKITDEDGKVAQSVRYDAFGNVNFLNGPDDNNYLFAGKPYDRATGLIYFGARYYDPQLGRYLSRDPLTQGTNHYIYADNNPLVKRDIFGLWLSGGGMGGEDYYGGGGFDAPNFDIGSGMGIDGGGYDAGSGYLFGLFFNLGVSAIGMATGIQLPQMDMSTVDIWGSGYPLTDEEEELYEKYPEFFEIVDDVSAPEGTRLSSAEGIPQLEVSYNINDIIGRESENTKTDDENDHSASTSYNDQQSINDIVNRDPTFNLVPPYTNSGDTFALVTKPAASIDPPSTTFLPVGGGSAGYSYTDTGLPQFSQDELSKWQLPVEFASRPPEVADFEEQPDKPNSSVQQQQATNNSTDAINNSGDPVMLHSGDLVQSVVDLKIPGRGLDYEFRRTYRSRVLYSGPLGFNWDHNYNKRLVPQDNGNIARFDGDARFDIYVKNDDGSYTSPPGRFDVLMKHGDGTYSIRDRYGMIFNYDSDGHIANIIDGNGNRIRFEYGGSDDTKRLERVADSLDCGIAYEYYSEGTAQGRLRRIVDFTGRIVSFDYDDNLDLVTVTSPSTERFPEGKTTRYTYSSGFSEDKKELNHNLLTVTDPKGQTYLYNEYSVFDRVTRQQFGDEGWFSFQYSQLASQLECNTPEDISETLYRTRVTDRSGNLTVYDYNCQGNPLAVEEFTRSVRSGDPGSYLTTYTYNIDGKTTSITYPEGDRLELVYENTEGAPHQIAEWSSGNLVEVRRMPDPDRGGGAGLSTRYTYEYLYNRPIKIIDPRGMSEPARYTTKMWYDYQEGFTVAEIAAALGISQAEVTGLFNGISLQQGDLNGDGISDQSGGNVIKIENPAAHDLEGIEQQLVQRFQYNDHGQITKAADEAGVETDYIYDGGYLARTVGDPGGLNITGSVTRDDTGNVVAYADANGNATSLVLNNLNQIIEKTEPNGAKTRYTYDLNDKLTRVERQNLDQNGEIIGGNEWLTSIFEYNILDRPVLRRDEISEGEYALTEYQYDLNENLIRIIQPEGNSVFVSYDERDLPYQVTKGYGTADASTETIYYDGDRNPVRITDPLGNTKTFTYDGFNRRIAEVFDGKITSYRYDPLGLITDLQKLKDGTLLSDRSFVYDEAGRVLSIDESEIADGAITGNRVYNYKYNQLGKPVEYNPPLPAAGEGRGEGVYAYTYDPLGRLLTTIDPESNQIVNIYDSNGNILSQNNRQNHETLGLVDNTMAYEYNSDNLPIKKTDNAGNEWLYNFSSTGNLLKITDPMSNITRFEYDALGRLERKMEELDITTTYAWDDNSRLVSMTDAANNTTIFGYDSQNRRILTLLPDESAYLTKYNKNSGLSEFTSPNGFKVSFTYDPSGNLIRRAVSQNNIYVGKDEFDYDGLNRLISANSFNQNDLIANTISRSYNSFGDMLSSAQQGKTLINGYNSAGFRNSAIYPDSAVLSLSRDSIGRLAGIQDAIHGNLAAFEYAGISRKSSARYGNNTSAVFAYDNLSRLNRFAWSSPTGDHITDHALAYDNVGNVEIDEFRHQGTNGNTYEYDSIYRLICAANGEVVTPPLCKGRMGGVETHSQQEFDYDSIYNFTTVSEKFADPEQNIQRTYTSNNLNQYESIQSSPLPSGGEGGGEGAGTFSILYDESGNLVQDGRFSYTYNWRNLITEVRNASDDSLIVEYSYDALGRRISKIVHDPAHPEPPDPVHPELVEGQTFIYDGWQVIEERNAADEVMASYIYSDLDEPVAMTRDGSVYYYHYNHQGSIEVITNQAGEIVERYEYDPFGKVTIKDASGEELEQSAIGNPYYYTGRRLDDETGLYYYRNRYYNADLGRFIQRDPLGYVDSMNLYAYALSNPVNRDDPYGLLDPTAMEDQRRAVCGGARDCRVDMTPNTFDEFLFQRGMAVGIIAGPPLAVAVGTYGPAACMANPVLCAKVGTATVAAVLKGLDDSTTGMPPKMDTYEEFGVYIFKEVTANALKKLKEQYEKRKREWENEGKKKDENILNSSQYNYGKKHPKK